MAFKDLDEFLEPTLKLPIRGKTYTVESVDAKTGLWCQRMMHVAATAFAGIDVPEADAAALSLDDEQELSLYQRVLGATYDEMVTDGVPWEWVKHAGITAFMWAAGNRQQAEDFWASPGKARPATQDRRPKKKKSAPRG